MSPSTRGRTRSPAPRRGGALVTSLIAVVVLTGIVASVFSLSLASSREAASMGGDLRSLYLAEAGLNEAIAAMAVQIDAGEDVPTDHGTSAAPLEVGEGRYFAEIADNGDETYTVTSTGIANLSRRSVQAVVVHVGGSAFDHAVFAGNSSGDPDYELRLGGVGSEADEITGDVYSGGDIAVSGDATVDGNLVASGGISGAGGDTGRTRPIPDIVGMDYAVNHDVDVAAAFSSGSQVWRSNALGGNAWELPESEPAHIFRKNPDDRTTETAGTSKDDFFLEDPYMPVTDHVAPETNGDAHSITLSGTMGAPGVSGTDKVYYVDGNLWVHNKPFMRLRFRNEGPEGVRVTFVVRGNVYFSDDVYIADDDADGVAFIAIADEDEPDSGNIYFGDPRYGTLDMMETFLYAQNNFYDLNLSADGSKEVLLHGNMTAGNHVSIERDYQRMDGTVRHSKLGVEFDDRLSTGELVLPGIPMPVQGPAGLEVVFWREVATDR